ncbi:methyltransferase domain-containing protein [Saccharopolyspora sp. CA-218241]|uniref:methyltransferase domain-containing protein n=1 Tax=Saccharopolyspora sp. CA-218241 TaxID=3240027 RepID=UPI003D96BCF3
MTVRVLARTLRGLEDVAAEELTGRDLGRVERTRHREVWFTADRPDPRLLDLRTVDDLFLLADVVDDVGHTKRELARLAEAARTGEPGELLRTRARCGGVGTATAVDVAASFLGKRNYNRYDIEDAVGTEIADALGLPYHSRRGGSAPPEGSLSFRVTIEGTQAALALRIGDRPLHRRPYKQASTPGTLHPPLAAAMALLAGTGPTDTVLDPCCGTGTLLIEAADLGLGARLLGADHDPRALAAATANAATTGTAATWLRSDAGRLPVATGRIDRIVSNPPWDRQVAAHGSLAARPDRFHREIRRVLSGSGRAVLLLHEAEAQRAAAEAAGLRVREVRPVSLFGTHPSVVTLTG